MSQLKTRITLKHDTEANWLKATNFVPKAGEMIIYDADSTHSAPRLKVGDGETSVNDLYFANAFKNNLTITETIGAFSGTPSNPFTIEGSAGKTAEDLLMEAFGVVADVEIVSRPTVKNNQSSYIVEMGTADPIDYNVSFIQGTYSNGQKSSVNFSNTIIEATIDGASVAKVENVEASNVPDSGTLSNISPIESTVTVSINSSYSNETRTDLKDFNGKPIPADKLIKGGSVQKTYTVTPKRGCFYGFTKEQLNIDNNNASSSIRGLKDTSDKTSEVVEWGEWTTELPTSIDTCGKWKNFYIAISSNEYTESELTIIDSNNLVVACEYLGEYWVSDARNSVKEQSLFKVFAAKNLQAYNHVTLRLNWK